MSEQGSTDLPLQGGCLHGPIIPLGQDLIGFLLLRMGKLSILVCRRRWS